jgi:hypothetical protein
MESEYLMSNHEHFRELCALAAIGQLTSDEDREVTQHLFECESCRTASLEYAHVVQHQLPKGDPIRWRMKGLLPNTAPDFEVRERFLARALTEGVEFSPEVIRSSSGAPIKVPDSRGPWRNAWAAAAVAAIAILGVGFYRVGAHRGSAQETLKTQEALAAENRSLAQQLDGIQKRADSLSAELKEAQASGINDADSLERITAELAQERAQSESLSAQLQVSEAKRAELSKAGQQKDALISDLNGNGDKLAREDADNLSARVVLESQVRDLNQRIEQQASSFEQERELMMASKDVRQLMGARNLHILDVHDTDGEGRSSKAFGRVFYAEGQSLIFYAFDLPSGKLVPAKYSFEAWGEKESVSHSVRNLGTFVVDDHEQRRWVLKVTEPKLLKGIDSVFVTAESLTDAPEPRGKKLLYAYIVGQPNHP